MSDKIAVMYLGKLVEHGNTDLIFNSPMHPYTEALFAAIPTVESNIEDIKTLKGEIPSAINLPSGCRFHTRCPCVMSVCKTNEPKLFEIDNGRKIACHLYNK